MSRPLVLIVNADRAAARAVEAILKEAHYRISITRCATEALSFMEQRLPHVVFCEIDQPSADGFMLLREVRARWPLIPFILVTATRDIADAVRAIRVRMVTCLLKPIAPPEILRAVEETLGPSAQHVTGRLIGESSAMARVFEMILIAARSSRNVLITGETGTGKQLVAEAIHEISERGARPLIEVNCAAIPGELLGADVFKPKISGTFRSPG
jgi:DNA-binding NtrC family response regulator